MEFTSTNHHTPPVNFKTALFAGLAPDGGLYMPTSFPILSLKEIKSLSEKSLSQIGSLILTKWIEHVPPKDFDSIAHKSLTFPIPLKTVGSYSVLELFHGPTQAFKDVAASVLSELFDYYLAQTKKRLTLLVATSGDTGGAIAQAFSGSKKVRVVILYPHGRVSALQEEQLTRVGKNVFPLAVKGDFDACQAFVKQAFIDTDLTGLHLSSANSISLGRLLPQIIYYAWAYAQLPQPNLQFIVPSGNMGNVTAGLFAAHMGLPFRSFIIATNRNDAAVKYYRSGRFEKQTTIRTLSTAMDIGNPSNFLRILELFGHNHTKFNKLVKAIKITDKETVSTIKEVHQKYHYLIDFHTAVAFAAAEKTKSKNLRQVILATASPIKFATEIKKATGLLVDDSREIARLRQNPKRGLMVKASYPAIKTILTTL